MIKDFVMGLSATFIFWVATSFFASSRLIYLNWRLYLPWNWSEVDRDTRVKMALWLSVPLFMAGLLWMRGVAFWGYLMNHYVSDFGLSQALGFLIIILFALVLSLWWAFDRSYGAARGDTYWTATIFLGLVLGAFSTFLSWYY